MTRPTPDRTVTSVAASAAEPYPDPRAVRVALARSLAHADLAPMVVEPMPVPIAPVPSVIGRGLLGGATAATAATAASTGPGSSTAPGQPLEVLVDGSAVLATLLGQGSGHATLVVSAIPDDGIDSRVEGAATITTRLLLEPPEPLPDGRGVVRREIVVDGWRIELDIESERRAALHDRARRGREESARGGPTEVHAIIPGRIVSVSVEPGEAVVASQQLLVVEAMKMQNELRAPRDGVITRVAVAAGETIEIGDLLLVIG
jgi:biotin carboxyl carrier protein